MPDQGNQNTFSTPQGSFELTRYPTRAGDPLQAWCSADTLLLSACDEQNIKGEHVLVANDDHGALSVALQPGALWTDSWLSAKAAEENFSANGRTAVPIVWSTDAPPVHCNTVVLRIPRQLPYFEYQLARLASTLPAGTTVLAAGMDKHLSPNTAELLDKHIGPTTRHRGRSRARVFSARIQPAGKKSERSGYSEYFCEPLGLHLAAAPNVFSRDKLDMGSRFLLENLHRLAPAERITDLACGNGVLGLAALQSGLSNALTACDESAMAVACTRTNFKKYAGASDVTVVQGDGLLGINAGSDLILCNPPFHLQQTVDDFAGRRLLEQAAETMPAGGRLCVVANRHLNYQQMLRRRFSQVELFAENPKFRIWLAYSS